MKCIFLALIVLENHRHFYFQTLSLLICDGQLHSLKIDTQTQKMETNEIKTEK